MKEAGNGLPAYVRHWNQFPDMHAKMLETNASLPAHPTQIYESLVGLSLFALLMWRRKKQTFRGEAIALLFVFAYGFVRFLLELLRDDVERGEFGPSMGKHLLRPGALLLFAFAFAISRCERHDEQHCSSQRCSWGSLLASCGRIFPNEASFVRNTNGDAVLYKPKKSAFYRLFLRPISTSSSRNAPSKILFLRWTLASAGTLAEEGPKRKKKRKQEKVSQSGGQ